MTEERSDIAVSIDIETLGLGYTAPIIQFGAAVFDIYGRSCIAEMEFLIRHYSYDDVEPYAASMHPKLLKAIGRDNDRRFTDEDDDLPIQQIVPTHEVCEVFMSFIENIPGAVSERGHIVAAGKNFAGFDHQLLKTQCDKWGLLKFHRRVLDPGNLYWRPEIDGVELPNMSTCLECAGMPSQVAHTALADAKAVVALVQRHVAVH